MIQLLLDVLIAAGFAMGSLHPSAASDSSPPVDERAEEIDRLLQAYAAHRSFSGAVAVADTSGLVYEGAFGFADREWRTPNEVNTRFSIASVTKPFTAALIMRLIDAGHLAQETPVTDVVPDYRSDTGKRITVHHLLSHTSGLPNYAGKDFWEGNPSRMDYEQADFIRLYCSGDLLFEPGTAARYSDANYYLLAVIAETVTETSFAEAMRSFVLDPIEARDTGNIGGGIVINRLARGYLRDGPQHRVPPPIQYHDVQLGAGDMYSTVGDLLRFATALRDDEFLSTASADAVFTAHSPSGFEGQSNGYGWNMGHLTLRDSGLRVPIRHAPGNNAGFAAVIYSTPADDVTITLIQNTGPGYLDMRVYAICEEILHIVFGETPRLPTEEGQ